MERTAYARLYATVTGAFLVLLGFVSLLSNTEFQARELTSELLGFYAINGWSGVFHVAAGLLGLLLARPLPRLYALLAGIVFTGLGIWGILAANGTWLLGGLPANRWANLVNLLIGLLGIIAYAASRWDRITAFTGSLGSRFEKMAENRRQKRRRRKIRKRRTATKSRA
ncbi:MAG TPA: DUF4383 domain-containing protein [Solirubrobacterales bacterium]|nr:DUF4383 domain-containing protein [Solirubrobacterales bacterium]HMU26191.1 DUF4383 domain-containing protein [Solirubrobacterales bacterium]HMW44940.1 DUF4383 domain-containing protein [Solirubrobacterales bacterium]HMX70302.1 DUF4383 domain-containing protein [Solirubrobacterales bacterium]HNA23669.1 DUF4383 domain-containing protein [Solirubrobacterales bacterium]